MIITKLDPRGGYLSHRHLDQGLPVPAGWKVLPVPTPPEVIGYRFFIDSWIQDPDYQPEPAPEVGLYGPGQISRIDFTRLFSGMQQASINAFRKACAALTPADYVDPSAGLLIQLEIVLQQFDLPAEFIELNHPDTRLGLELLGYAGVFGEDPATITSEIDRIIAGDLPA